VADQDMEFAIRGILGRPASIGIRAVSPEVYVHPEHDPGCLLRAHDFLRPFMGQFEHFLVMFDRHGSGHETESRETLEKSVEALLAQSGWKNRAAAIVIDPELEVWVWSDAPDVDRILGWAERKPGLRSWLHDQGWLQPGHAKPADPKEAFEQALRAVSSPRSSSIFRRMAENVSLRRCSDPSFQKLKKVLRRWFSAI
jgi:hypothetical protein